MTGTVQARILHEDLPHRQEIGRDGIARYQFFSAFYPSTQVRRNRVIAAYLDGHINQRRAAIVLRLSAYEPDEQFRRLNVPRRIGPKTIEKAQAEVNVNIV